MLKNMQNRDLNEILIIFLTFGLVLLWWKQKEIVFTTRRIITNKPYSIEYHTPHPLKKRQVVITQHAYKADTTSQKTPQLPPTPPGRQDEKLPNNKNNNNNQKYIWAIPVIILAIIISNFFKDYSFLFRASILELKPTEFTGTVMPVEKVPKWTALSNSERRMTYDQLPKSKIINIPPYNLADIRAGKNWKTSTDHQRNAYITYPVPNLGNYMLDATENSGSHTGIDIKIPVGTPIRTIANGVIYKVDYQKTGFGKYVSIAHVSIPDPENPDRKATYFSNYAHLSSINVTEGQEVKTGQVIGKSGDTGSATTAHLHFQLDKSSAPFHPYWPFQWKDVTAAGLNSYFEAVKKGVGKGNAVKHTYHPIDFITQFSNYIPANYVASNKTIIPDEPKNKSLRTHDLTPPVNTTSTFAKVPEAQKTTPIPTNPRTIQPASTSNASSTVQTKSRMGRLEIEFVTDRSFVPGEDKIVTVRINDANLVASNGILLSSTDRRAATVTPRMLTKNDFNTKGESLIMVKSSEDRTFKIIAKSDNGEAKSASLRAQVFSDVVGNYPYADAIKYLKENNIVGGYPDGTFKPGNTINRAEAVKIILSGNDIPVSKGSISFPDVPTTAWFHNNVTTAADWGIVKGYGDGYFKPENTISRAEFLKVAILTAGFKAPTVIRTPYPDVPKDAWFAPFFQFNAEYDLLRLKRGGFIVPHEPITRGEAADVMYRLARLQR